MIRYQLNSLIVLFLFLILDIYNIIDSKLPTTVCHWRYSIVAASARRCQPPIACLKAKKERKKKTRQCLITGKQTFTHLFRRNYMQLNSVYTDECSRNYILKLLFAFDFKPFLVVDVPSPPTIKKKSTETVSCDVNLTWSTPLDNGCPLTRYSVYYKWFQPREPGAPWNEVKITDVLRTHHILLLRCDQQYLIEMSAWNELGESGRSKTWITKTISGTSKN